MGKDDGGEDFLVSKDLESSTLCLVIFLPSSLKGLYTETSFAVVLFIPTSASVSTTGSSRIERKSLKHLDPRDGSLSSSSG